MFFSMNERSYEGIRDVKARRLRGKSTSLYWSQRNAAALGETAVHRILETVGGEETLQHLAELRLPLVGGLRLAVFPLLGPARCLVALHDVAKVHVDFVVFGCQHQFVVGEFFHNEYSGVATALNLQQLLSILF